MRYTLAKEAPKSLDEGCYVIDCPNFYREIDECVKKRPRSNMMTRNYLRELVATVGLRYAVNESFNPLTDVNVSNFIGLPIENNEDINIITLKAFRQYYPQMVDYWIDYHIKNRPKNTKLIYFLGREKDTKMFQKHGADFLQYKDVDVYLEKKPKKVVGKPAITKEQAENAKNAATSK